LPIRKTILLLLLASSAFGQKTMTEASLEIRQLLPEVEVPNYWTKAQIDTAWVHALRETALLAGNVVMHNAKLQITAGTNLYALADTVTRVRAVYLFYSADSANRPDHFLRLVDSPAQIPFLKGQLGPEYCFLSGRNLVLDPMVSATESVMVYQYIHPTFPTDSVTATNLPRELLRAPIWLAASFLMNQNHQYSASEIYYKRATDLISAYKLNYSTQALGGALPAGSGK
jgi:hypothetical protein